MPQGTHGGGSEVPTTSTSAAGAAPQGRTLAFAVKLGLAVMAFVVMGSMLVPSSRTIGGRVEDTLVEPTRVVAQTTAAPGGDGKGPTTSPTASVASSSSPTSKPVEGGGEGTAPQPPQPTSSSSNKKYVKGRSRSAGLPLTSSGSGSSGDSASTTVGAVDGGNRSPPPTTQLSSSSPSSPANADPAQEGTANGTTGDFPVPKYMRRLESHFNFSLATSFSDYNVDFALGKYGINISLEDRFKRESDDGIERFAPTRDLNSMRLLGTETIVRKYGMTNVLMTIASMMAYAGIDDRAIVFPWHSPIPVEKLLDLNETTKMLEPVNILLFTFTEATIQNVSKGMRAKKLKMGMGTRSVIGSMNPAVAAGALSSQIKWMKATKKYQYFVQRNFFLSFPFRSTAPLDACFYLKRMIFHRNIRDNALRLLKALKEEKGVKRLLTVHLRLEFDSGILDPKASKMTPEELQRFFKMDLIPIAKSANIDAIYICAGGLKKEYVAAMKSVGFPVYFKSDFQGTVSVSPDQALVTSHEGAAMDTLLLSMSPIAVTFQLSTLTLAVASQRCPSPAAGITAIFEKFRRSTVVKWRMGNVTSAAPADTSSTISTTAPSSGGFLKGPIPRNRFQGSDSSKSDDVPPQSSPSFFVYSFLGKDTFDASTGKNKTTTRFSRLHYIDCDHPVGSQCFYHGLTPEEESLTDLPGIGETLDIPSDDWY